MARYYDLNKLAEMIQAKADTLIEGKEAFLYVAKWLDKLPAADVVEVVRCKDCEHYLDGKCYVTNHSTLFKYDVNIHSRKEDDFCSYGTPKERR